jgi:glyoxylase-like metal-dependent hydrolase (beta-lactamase superfamily II)
MKPQATHEWRVGKYTIQLVIQDWFWLWGEILWSGIPMEKWTEWGWHRAPYQLGEKNKIRNSINCFLISSPEGSRILVDTSVGKSNQWEKGTIEDFLLENGFNLFDEGLRQPDIVIPTHLHFDHALGCAKMEEGKLVPAFPNATYIFHEDELGHALETHPMTRSSYRRETIQGIRAVLEQGAVLCMMDEKMEIGSGITLIRTRGHTPGHLSVKIESEGQVALIPGALFPSRFHALAPCKVGNDTHPLEGYDNWKRPFLEEAHRENWLVLLEHDPDIAFKVLRDEKGNYQLIPTGN